MTLDDFDAPLEGEPGDGAAEAKAERPMIMVVDDDASVLDALEDILKESYDVLVFSSGAAAVDAVNDNICAVILDVKMGDHDGFWTCDEIRKKNSHVPVIFFSAYQDVKDPFDIINHHQPFGYVTKGTSSALLLDLLGRAVRYFTLIKDGRKMIDDLQRIHASMQKNKSHLAS